MTPNETNESHHRTDRLPHMANNFDIRKVPVPDKSPGTRIAACNPQFQHTWRWPQPESAPREIAGPSRAILGPAPVAYGVFLRAKANRALCVQARLPCQR